MVTDYTNSSTGHDGKLNCEKCNFGYLWKDLNDKFLCIASSQLPSANITPNCKRYGWDDPNFVCIECSNDTFLSDTNTCVLTCSTVLKRKLTFNNNNNKTAITEVYKNICNATDADKIYHTDSG